jgi:flagellar assembly factor FliW
MSEINLKVDVHCKRPDWSFTNVNPICLDNKYRIYINNDLITERNWIWGNDIFLCENIWIKTKNIVNNVRLESVLHIPEQAKFTLKNFKVINYKYAVESEEDTKISFKIINT